jgi:peptide/nickel transport system substrate-binding protein
VTWKILLSATSIAIGLAVGTAVAQQQRDLVIGIDGDIKNFNVDQQFDQSWFPSTLYYERLTGMDYGPDFKIRPLLAKSWDMSADGLTYTFRLQQGVTWHDGQPFTSQDVKATFEGIVENNTYSAPPLKVISSIETPDDLTVVIRLKQPSASFLPNISTYPRFAILPAHLYKGKPWDKHPNNLAPVGTGPYKLEEHRRGEYISFIRNENYWGPRPEIKRVIYRIVPDQNVQIAQLQSGEIQAMNNPPPLAMEPILSKSEGVVVDAPPGPMTYYLAFNVTKPPFNNQKVRQALAFAIDRNQLAERATFGIYKPARGTYVQAISWAFNDKALLPEPNQATAAKLLDEAGFPVKSGRRFSFDIWVSRPTEITTAQIIREQLRPLGVDVRVNQLEDILMRSRLADMQHDSYMYGNWWGPDPSEWANYTVTGQFWNRMGYSNPRVDELFAAGDLALTQEERAKHYGEIQKILLDDMPRLPLYDSGPYSFARRTDLTGWFTQEPLSFRADLRNLRWGK